VQRAAASARDAFPVEKLQFIEMESFLPGNKSNILLVCLFPLNFPVWELSEYLIFIFKKTMVQTF